MTFETFENVTNKRLQTYNRCAMTFNILGDHGRDIATQYTSQFSNEDKELMRGMMLEIQERGYEKVRAELNRSVH